MTFETLVVFDKKKAAGHLSGLACIEKAVSLRELLHALEDNGEAMLGFVFGVFLRHDAANLDLFVCRSILAGQRWIFPSLCQLGNRDDPTREKVVLFFGSTT